MAKLRKALLHKDPKLRLGAVRRLARLAAPGAVALLCRALKDKAAEVVLAASSALLKRKSTAVPLPTLKGLLDDPNRKIRFQAARILKRYKSKEALPLLRKAMGDVDPYVRHSAIHALKYNADKEGARRLYIGLAIRDKTSWAQANALRDAAHFKHRDTVRALRQLLQNKRNRRAKIQALGLIGTPEARQLLRKILASHSDKYARSDAMYALRLFRDPKSKAAIVRALKDAYWMTRKEAVLAIGRWPSAKDRLPLLEMVSDPSLDVVLAALGVFEKTRDRRAVAPIIKLLLSHRSFSFLAAKALGRIGDKAATPALCKAARQKKAQLKRYSSIRALGQLKDRSASATLVGLLQDRSANIRRHAIEAMAKIADPATLQPLVKATNDADVHVRRQLMKTLAVFRATTKALSGLLAGLRDKDSTVRILALRSLRRLKAKGAAAAIQKQLAHSDPKVALEAARTLRSVAKSVDVFAILSSLAKNRDQKIRALALWELRASKDRRALPLFLRGLNDPYYDAYKHAVLGLVEHKVKSAIPAMLGRLLSARHYYRNHLARRIATILRKGDFPLVAKLLHHHNPRIRRAGFILLGALRERRHVPLLLKGLKDRDRYARRLAREAIISFGKELVTDALLPLLRSPSPRLRIDVIKAFGALYSRKPWLKALKAFRKSGMLIRPFGYRDTPRGQTVARRLHRALKDPRAEVRAEAAFSLGKLVYPSSVKPLCKALQDPSLAVRRMAVSALRHIPSAQATLPLLETLKSEDQWLRADAARALGKIRDRRAIKPLQKLLLQDKSVYVRRAAAFAIARLGGPNATKVLLRVLALENNRDVARKYRSRDVLRKYVLQALGMRKERRLLPLILPYLKVRGMVRSAVRALMHLGQKPAVPALLKAFQQSKSDWLTRANIIYALGNLKDVRGLPLLLKSLKSKHYKTRYYACYALEQIKDRRTVPAFIEALKDPYSPVRICASSHLIGRAGKRSIPALTQALGDASWLVRANATRALGLLRATGLIPTFVKQLKDKRRWLRFNSARTLALLGDKRALPTLKRARKDWDIRMRILAKRVLARWRTRNAPTSRKATSRPTTHPTTQKATSQPTNPTSQPTK